MARVILDAGHGGYDNGATYMERKEKDDNLNLALAVGNILENEGVDVVYTRTSDVYQSPTQKAQIANNLGGDFFVSFHRNAGPEPNTYSGAQTLVFANDGLPSELAKNINTQLEKVGFTNLGIEERRNLAVLRRTQMPAVLVETGFLDTDRDNQLFDLKFPEVAQAIADGILETIQENSIGITEDSYYAVQTGVFRHWENADYLAKSMQEDGYPSTIDDVRGFYFVRHGKFSDRDEAEHVRKELESKKYETIVVEL